MKAVLKSVALACALMVASQGAHAAASASVGLSALKITLIDLNPADAVAPSITFDNPYGYATYVWSSAAQYGGAADYSGSASSYGPGLTLNSWVETAGIAVGDGQVAGSSAVTQGADPVYGLHSAYTQASVALVGDPYSVTDVGYVQSGFNLYPSAYSGPGQFALSAFTLAIFTGQVDWAVDLTEGADNVGGYEYASAYWNAQVSGLGASGSGYQSSSDGDSLSASYAPTSLASSRSFALSFMNLSTADLYGNVQAAGNAYVHSSIAAAVPESGSLPLALAGLGVAGWVLRRRGHAGVAT